MAAYISFQPSDFFNTKLYTGTGSSLAITGVGFQPDFVWTKNRDATDNHNLFDSPRGVREFISSNMTSVETTGADSLNSFDSDGFTLGTWWMLMVVVKTMYLGIGKLERLQDYQGEQ